MYKEISQLWGATGGYWITLLYIRHSRLSNFSFWFVLIIQNSSCFCVTGKQIFPTTLQSRFNEMIYGTGCSHTLFLVEVLLVGGFIRGRLDVCIFNCVQLLLHRHVEGGLIFAHVHVSSVALTSEGHIAGRKNYVCVWGVREGQSSDTISSHPITCNICNNCSHEIRGGVPELSGAISLVTTEFYG